MPRHNDLCNTADNQLTPAGRDLDDKPEHVAPLVVWLCTDAASNVNGRTFVVGGDMIGIYPEPAPERVIVREGGWDLDALDRLAPTQLINGLTNAFGISK